MSWSVNCSGKPEEVKQSLQTHFANATAMTTSYPVENETVVKAHQICNLVVDQMVTAGKVQEVSVSAFGSATCDKDVNYATSFNLSINWKA